MNKAIWLLYILLNVSFIYANGNKEPPDEYVDLGKIEVTQGLELHLPYKKPAGTPKIVNHSRTGLIINRILVDNKLIKVKKHTWFDLSANEAMAYLDQDIVDEAEVIYYLPMYWGMDEKGLVYDYYTRNNKFRYFPDYYKIPYGSREIYIEYRIRLVKDKELKEGEYGFSYEYIIPDDIYVVRFELIWSDKI
ncbi:hypothetical protein FACS189485_19070 [Spirochaetia bacterium]|nr:hypothetical protein FACS189485_19070 [Spirochaetia bacterium]